MSTASSVTTELVTICSTVTAGEFPSCMLSSGVEECLCGESHCLTDRDESRFWEEMEKHIDLNNSTHLWLNTANRWTGIRLVSFWASWGFFRPTLWISKELSVFFKVLLWYLVVLLVGIVSLMLCCYLVFIDCYCYCLDAEFVLGLFIESRYWFILLVSSRPSQSALLSCHCARDSPSLSSVRPSLYSHSFILSHLKHTYFTNCFHLRQLVANRWPVSHLLPTVLYLRKKLQFYDVCVDCHMFT